MNAKVGGRSVRGRTRLGWMDGMKRTMTDRRVDVKEASERDRNRNEWRMTVMQFCLASAVATGLPYGGNPVVRAVREMASMKRCKLWKTERMGCVAPAASSELGRVLCHC